MPTQLSTQSNPHELYDSTINVYPLSLPLTLPLSRPPLPPDEASKLQDQQLASKQQQQQQQFQQQQQQQQAALVELVELAWREATRHRCVGVGWGEVRFVFSFVLFWLVGVGLVWLVGWLVWLVWLVWFGLGVCVCGGGVRGIGGRGGRVCLNLE